MTLQEIEKLRKVYSDLKELWRTSDMVKYNPQPLHDICNMIEKAVWDRHDAAVKGTIEDSEDPAMWKLGDIKLPNDTTMRVCTDGTILRIMDLNHNWIPFEIKLAAYPSKSFGQIQLERNHGSFEKVEVVSVWREATISMPASRVVRIITDGKTLRVIDYGDSMREFELCDSAI